MQKEDSLKCLRRTEFTKIKPYKTFNLVQNFIVAEKPADTQMNQQYEGIA